MDFAFFIIVLLLALLMLAYECYKVGHASGIERMEKESRALGYGEFYLDSEGERQFRWVSTTIVKERK